MKTNTSNQSGFTLVEIMIVVAIIGLLAAIAIPNFVKARTTAQEKSCIANLKQIDSAVQQWAVENKKTASDTYLIDNAEILTYLKGSLKPVCPSSGTYNAAGAIAVSATPTCSVSGHTL